MSVRDIISNLRESLSGGVVPFKEMKVMVVGEPAVGKTTMLRVLYGQTSRDLATRPSVATDGIDLGEVTLDDFRLTFWDFAGQEVYRYTHQLFLSDNSLCLVMYRVTTPDEEARHQLMYWMDSVFQRAPNAMCLLVGTCARNFPEVYAESRVREHLGHLQYRYGQRVCGGVAIDSMFNYGFPALRKELLRMSMSKVRGFSSLVWL